MLAGRSSSSFPAAIAEEPAMAEDSAPAFHLRDAVAEDMGEVARIYAHYVQTSYYTFEEVPPTAEEMRARLRQVRQNGLPWRVVEGRGGAVLGYVYAAPFRARSAYRYTVENSVYVAPDQAQRGAGMALMRDLIRECTASGYRQMMAVICAHPNEAPIPLHTPPSLRTASHAVSAALQFGRLLDLQPMQ